MPDHDQPTSHPTASESAPESDHVDLNSDLSSSDPMPSVSVAAPASTPRLNACRYQLLDEIAHGGMGVIWRATDTALGREIAVKVLLDKFAPDSGTARRFADEARITAQLQHPAIPPVHDYGTLPDGRPFLAMKLIKSNTLDRLLEDRPDPSHDRGRYVAVFEQMCQALAYAHAHEVIHRDLKPANVMVGAFGEVQVMDWGLAKVLTGRGRERPEEDPRETRAGTEVVSLRDTDDLYTQAGSVLGTPAFMPPEQAVGAVGKVDARSDVFGLGAILAVILTGQPPFAAASGEAARIKAAQGKVQECFDRLDSCGADPELVALCKRCLASEKDDRPAGAGAVARAVGQLRAAADERARKAEMERVRLEAEQAADQARATERRKRRRLAVLAAAALVAAVVGGLSAVLIVHVRANAELAEGHAKVEARFEMALKAIATFHTGVSEDVLLKNKEFTDLRAKLLKEAAGFYSELEKLLAVQTDAKSIKLLADSYFQLGDLTEKIGDQQQALAVQRQALALLRELAAATGADVEARLNVARSLQAVGSLLNATGDSAGALAAYEEARDLASALEAGSPADAVRGVLAKSYDNIGLVLAATGKSGEALQSHERARAIWQTLADANPDKTRFQTDLAWSRHNLAVVLRQVGKPEEALKSHEQALAIRQKLAVANPAVTQLQRDLAWSHLNRGIVLWQTGKPREALKSYEQALDIQEKVVAANAAVTKFQRDLAWTHHRIGLLQLRTGKMAEALKSYGQALAIEQRLSDANPASTDVQYELARNHYLIGWALKQTGKLAEALESYEQSRAILQKLAAADPARTEFQADLANSHNDLGGVLSRQGRWTEAIAAYQEASTLRQKLAEANPTVPDYQKALASSLSRIGIVQRRSGKAAAAATSLKKAVAILERLPTLTPGRRYNLACYRALLAGVAVDSGSGMTPAEGEAAADQAMVALRQAVAGGWRNLANLKSDPDLDALRSRPDFRQLVKELETKSR
jgi:serine/threonine protein kinase